MGDGLTPQTQRHYPAGQDLLASTDERFRPINARTGPDGENIQDHGNYSGGPDAEPAMGTGTMQEQLETFIEYAKYPLDSRPLYGGELDLLLPYAPQQVPTPLINLKCMQPGTECEAEERLISVTCTVKPQSVMAIQATEFELIAYCLDANGKHIDLSKFQAEIYLEVEGKRDVLQPPPKHFADDGSNGDRKAGDGIYHIVLGLGPKAWGWMNLTLRGEYEGQPVKTMGTLCFSTPHKVAEFLPPIQESIKDGSLVIQVPVQIHKAGWYEFDANLMQAEGEKKPIARAYNNTELTAGRHVIEFLFFGKVLRDRAINGPYELKNLRGRRNNSPVTPADLGRAAQAGVQPTPRKGLEHQPDFEYISPGPEYTTQKAYFAEDFSDAEWTSEFKTARLEMLREWAEEEKLGF